jgi:ubiquinone/menaquinone biosynthesis C-methylase UbiE
MAAPFDHIAPTYDSLFTQSVIGQLQRKQVWKYVQGVIDQLDGYEMLELNYGTGEDLQLFGETGFNLVATDLGGEVRKISEKKAAQLTLQHRVSSQYVDLGSFNETLFQKKFDLVFSNFGGMNCVNPQSVKKLMQRLPDILNPGGRFVAVMMPKFCAWETIFFLLRLQFSKAFRRFTSREVITDIFESDMKTWFYSPAQFKRWSRKQFKVVSLKPVGVALPSIYLERFFKLKKSWLKWLNDIELKVSGNRLFSGMADNFIIDLQLK